MKFWWIAIGGCLVMTVISQAPSNKKCLMNYPEVNPKKYFHFDHQALTITLEASKERVMHQLTTWIFYIFVKEVLGYAQLNVSVQYDYFNVSRVIEQLSDVKTRIPNTTINVEAWIPPEYDTFATEYIKECGNLAQPGRFGWYIPVSMQQPIQNFYNPKQEPDVRSIHWRFFREQKFVKIFQLDDDVLKHVTDTYAKRDDQYICNNSTICQDSMYTPPQCAGGSYCAILLGSYFEATGFVIDHIIEDNLYVKVLFLGENLYRAAKYVKDQYRGRKDKSMIIFSWTPSDVIINEEDYISVAFEGSERMNFTHRSGYRYEMHRLVKVAWNKIEDYAKPLYEGFRSFRFSDEDYMKLLNRYDKVRDAIDSKNITLYDLACDWMNANNQTWINWKTFSQKSKIYIGGIFPLTASSYNGKGIVIASTMAMNAINSNNSILPDYQISILTSDGQCQADNVMRHFIEYIRLDTYYNNLAGVLGPACSDTVEPLAGVSKHYRVLVISYSAEGASFSDRAKYPYFFRTIGENKHYKHVYRELFKKWMWKRVAAFSEDGQKYTEYISSMQDELKNIEFVTNKKFPQERGVESMTRYLEDLKSKDARVIISDVVDEVARQVMCEAYKLKMTARDGYVWFLPMWLNHTWYDTDYFNQLATNKTVNCTTAEMKQAIQGYFSMTHAYFAPDNATMQEGITVAEWKEKYYAHKNLVPSDYAGFAYDAVWVYALALDKLYRTDPEAAADLHSDSTTSKLVELVEKTDFNGVSGRIKFRGGPSRFSIINILEWYNGKMNFVGEFHPHLEDDKPEISGGTLMLNDSAVKWFTPNEQIPDDGTPEKPVCAIESIAAAFNVECQTAIIILNVIIAIFLVLTVCGVCLYLKIKYDQKVKKLTLEKIFPSDLEDLEMDRENVVLTRRLGEGAFGTVYGGDAKFPKFKDGSQIPYWEWVAVAVKTLKSESSTEDKIDFLSEADNMKRFDHKNIIKLLGVVTKDQPIYTVMEFMLHGDLKTYLLARRHLVNNPSMQNTPDSEDVSPKRLTNMALDIARGLSYLAELKYIHRDLACRNCLVSSDKSVKIGDFGMTRPMNDYECYKFNRKGMLPVSTDFKTYLKNILYRTISYSRFSDSDSLLENVRWMATESLISGVYTPASDVWSFGVVLYEIVTFGCFPFYGKTNTEVVELVKNGFILEVPRGVKPQLEALMKSCWHQNPKTRPTASQIVEFLATNPRLLSACTEVVPMSIQLEELHNLSKLPLEIRRSSTTSNFGGEFSAATPKSLPMYGSHRNVGATYDQAPERHRFSEEEDTALNIQMDNYCQKRPLLGKGKSTSSLISKYQIGNCRRDSGCQEEDEGFIANSPPNGYISSSKL